MWTSAIPRPSRCFGEVGWGAPRGLRRRVRSRSPIGSQDGRHRQCHRVRGGGTRHGSQPTTRLRRRRRAGLGGRSDRLQLGAVLDRRRPEKTRARRHDQERGARHGYRDRDHGEARVGRTHIERFVVSGVSKRGWTTWLAAAVDERVVGIAPIVFDVLNMEASIRHHFAAYGTSRRQLPTSPCTASCRVSARRRSRSCCESPIRTHTGIT